MRHRADTNHAEIADAYKALGFLVKSTSQVGEGFPDLVVFRRDVGLRLVEVKKAKGKLRLTQSAFQAKGWPVDVVRTVDDVIASCSRST